jgi:hypothetical protein
MNLKVENRCEQRRFENYVMWRVCNADELH